jgi:hypothetical protein
VSRPSIDDTPINTIARTFQPFPAPEQFID